MWPVTAQWRCLTANSVSRRSFQSMWDFSLRLWSRHFVLDLFPRKTLDNTSHLLSASVKVFESLLPATFAENPLKPLFVTQKSFMCLFIYTLHYGVCLCMCVHQSAASACCHL